MRNPLLRFLTAMFMFFVGAGALIQLLRSKPGAAATPPDVSDSGPLWERFWAALSETGSHLAPLAAFAVGGVLWVVLFALVGGTASSVAQSLPAQPSAPANDTPRSTPPPTGPARPHSSTPHPRQVALLSLLAGIGSGYVIGRILRACGK